ncbi:CBY1-interacting BAR domain-containing protein 1-A-like [Tachypleus tridentatus]|uniref:CBY1-interacting BAR domain-containing protein 1-A-like n=1 Tax=Tachypleus tridentatus TaxID=6853 RepID=UPI003FD30C44
MDFKSSIFSDRQSRFFQERINTLEKNMADLCSQFASYVRKMARLRDNGDCLARSVLKFSESENLNLTLRNSLMCFADELSCIQDYREAEVRRLEVRVVEQLSAYGTICKHARDAIKSALSIKSKEISRRQQLEKIQRRSPTKWQEVSLVHILFIILTAMFASVHVLMLPIAKLLITLHQSIKIISCGNYAGNEYQRAAFDSNQSAKVLEEQMEMFEHSKVSNIKKIFTDFVNIELLFHTKALEIYTRAYSSLQKIDEDLDLKEVRNCIRASPHKPRLETIRATLQSQERVSSVNGQSPVFSRRTQIRTARNHALKGEKITQETDDGELDTEDSDTNESNAHSEEEPQGSIFRNEHLQEKRPKFW